MVTKYINHNTSTNKKRKANLEEDLLAGSTDVGRTGHHEDCGCSNLFWSFTKYMDTIIPMPIKRKTNLEKDLLAEGTEDCGCPRLDGYKVQIPVPIKKGKRTLKRIF